MVLDNMKNSKIYNGMHEKFEAAFEFIKKATEENYKEGKYEIDGKILYANISEYTTKNWEDAKPEGHKDYIDIQFLMSGKEIIEVFDISKAISKIDYNPEKDVEFYENNDNATRCVLEAGEFAIFFPHDIHRPSMAYNKIGAPVKKIVVKVRV